MWRIKRPTKNPYAHYNKCLKFSFLDTHVYHTKDINTINYDHLTITDDSEYKITSQVYKETCSDYYQYWIVYTATDKYGNKGTKTQAIAFEEEPSDDDVKDLKEIRSSVCTGKQ